jgi:hypothetical protein
MVGVPYEFTIDMFSIQKGLAAPMDHINKPGRSVLKTVSIDHAAAGKTAFVKSNGEYYPVSTTLTLAFQEVVLLARDSDAIKRPGGIDFTNTAVNPR